MARAHVAIQWHRARETFGSFDPRLFTALSRRQDARLEQCNRWAGGCLPFERCAQVPRGIFSFVRYREFFAYGFVEGNCIDRDAVSMLIDGL